MQEQLVNRGNDFKRIEHQISRAKDQFLTQELEVDQKQKESVRKEISDLFFQKQKLENSIIELKAQSTDIQIKIELQEIDRTKIEKQIHQLNDKQNNVLKSIDDLEKSLKEKQDKISTFVSNVDQVEEVQPDSKEWSSHLANTSYLPIFEHIEKYGVITESEICNILNGSRGVRQFARKFREYFNYLPFSIKVEASSSGNRYVKAASSTIDEQALPVVSSIITVEPELDFIETEQVILTYDVCRSCGKSPIPGSDLCYSCN